MQTLLIVLLAVPSGAAERGPKAPGTVAARRAAAQPSAMAVRRASGSSRGTAGAAAAPPATPSAPPVVPAAPADPEFAPRITPPTGTPTAGLDLRKGRGVAYAPAGPAADHAPLPPVGAEGASGAGPERAPAGVKGAAVTELKAGRTDRQFGGATDPVLFLVGGTGPSGSVTSSSDGSALNISLGAQR